MKESYKGAIDDYDTMLKLAPDRAGQFYARGYIYFKQGKKKEAEKAIKKGLKLDDDGSELEWLKEVEYLSKGKKTGKTVSEMISLIKIYSE